MKKLPSLFKNTNSNLNNHNKDYCYVNKAEYKEINNVRGEIIKLINKPNIFQIPLIIKTKDKTIITRIIKADNNSLLTINNEIININDIISIEK